MLTSQEFLFVFLLSVIASATNTDLANNTNFLLLLLLVLSGQTNNNQNNICCCRQRFVG